MVLFRVLPGLVDGLNAPMDRNVPICTVFNQGNLTLMICNVEMCNG